MRRHLSDMGDPKIKELLNKRAEAQLNFDVMRFGIGKVLLDSDAEPRTLELIHPLIASMIAHGKVLDKARANYWDARGYMRKTHIARPNPKPKTIKKKETKS